MVASPPRLCTLTALENAPQGGRPWSNRRTGRPARRRHLRLARTPQVKGRPVIGGETVSAVSPWAKNAEAGKDSCLGHLNGSLQNVNNVVFCTSPHKSETEQSSSLTVEQPVDFFPSQRLV